MTWARRGDGPGRRRAKPFAAAAAVGLVSFALGLPGALYASKTTPDAIGYVGAAANWLAGEGFVDAVLYSYYLPDVRPPVPATAIRPPVISLLLAPPLALGASWKTLTLLHLAWAGAIAAAGVLVARRAMSLPAATAFGIAVFWSPGWGYVSRLLLTEATAVGVLLLAFATASRALRSAAGAALLAAVTLLAWLTRPNLGLIAPAVLLAGVLELGPRRALRCRPLWTYALGFGALCLAAVAVLRAATGVPPYAHYGVMAEILDMEELSDYRKEYVGGLAFALQHSDAVLHAIGRNLRAFFGVVFQSGAYLHVGWLALPALLHALLRGGSGSFERRVAALAALGFTTTSLAVYGGFDVNRYLLLGAVCLWFAAAALLGDAAAWMGGWLAERVPALERPLPRASARALPLLLVLPFWALVNLPGWTAAARAQWDSYRQVGTFVPVTHWARVAVRMCPRIDRDALVASPSPWAFYFWCGNAGLLIPFDLGSGEWLERYLDEQAPGYVVTNRGPAFAPFAESARLEPLETHLGHTLYRVRNAPPESRPWRAPPPLRHLTSR